MLDDQKFPHSRFYHPIWFTVATDLRFRALLEFLLIYVQLWTCFFFLFYCYLYIQKDRKIFRSIGRTNAFRFIRHIHIELRGPRQCANNLEYDSHFGKLSERTSRQTFCKICTVDYSQLLLYFSSSSTYTSNMSDFTNVN